MASSKPKLLISDDGLLQDSNDDEIIEGDLNDDDYRMLHTPDSQRRGKSIRIGDNNSPNRGSTPPTTPPRPDRTSTPKPRGPEVPEGHHSTKLEIHIMTERNPLPHKVLSVLHKCTTRFYQHRPIIHKLINRAKMLLLNAEPYQTLMTQGYDFQLIKSQLSYKVLPLDQDELIDFLLDPETMHFSHPAHEHPIPFYERHGKQHVSQTDISFEFHINQRVKHVQPRKMDMATMTASADKISNIFDVITRNPIIWPTLHDNSTPQASGVRTPPPRLSLADCAPPRHHLDQQQLDRDRRNRPRPHQRLGPPVARQFKRSRSNEGRRGRGHMRHLDF